MVQYLKRLTQDMISWFVGLSPAWPSTLTAWGLLGILSAAWMCVCVHARKLSKLKKRTRPHQGSSLDSEAILEVAGHVALA